MPVRFAKPPIVELVAEVRWQVTEGVALPAGPVPLIAMQPEEFFMQVGSKVAARGFTRVERMVPPGFPSPAFQAVYRFRRDTETEGSTMYQVGSGIFTANITPPYHSWDRFRPVVSEGIGLLLEARGEADKPSFTQATLRYIDLFGEEYTTGRSSLGFMREALGFVVEVPPALQREVALQEEIRPALQFSAPLRTGQTLVVNVGQGFVNNEPGLIMDTTVSSPGPIEGTVAAVMTALDAAHDVIHRSFIEITRPLHALMQPA